MTLLLVACDLGWNVREWKLKLSVKWKSWCLPYREPLGLCMSQMCGVTHHGGPRAGRHYWTAPCALFNLCRAHPRLPCSDLAPHGLWKGAECRRWWVGHWTSLCGFSLPFLVPWDSGSSHLCFRLWVLPHAVPPLPSFPSVSFYPETHPPGRSPSFHRSAGIFCASKVLSISSAIFSLLFSLCSRVNWE